jgi:hypothetical protein
MNDTSPTCVKCGGEMAEGFILDKLDANAARPAAWQADKPVSSMWSGVKQRGREQHPITVYRCVACGYLESYAR